MTEPSFGLPWKEWYQIIKGICEGVNHLHQRNIVHRDLKPQNILLDDSMVPKIADFGISRRLSENKSKTVTNNRIGTRPYWAPEFLESGTITPKTDIYSLGVIIKEILMGRMECFSVDKVLETWANVFRTSSESQSLLQQVKVCAEIGINCMDDNPKNRPDIKDIISSLSFSIVRSAESTSPTGQLLSTGLSEAETLDAHPLELCFSLKPDGANYTVINITNKTTDRYVTYWIIPEFPDMYRCRTHRLIMEPMSTCPTNVSMVCQKQEPLDAGMFDILIIAMESRSNLRDLVSSIGREPKIDGDLLKRVEELGGEVHAAVLTAVVAPSSPQMDISSFAYNAKTVSRAVVEDIIKIDMHPTKPWILLCHDKYLSIWDYEQKETIVKIEVRWEAGNIYPIAAGRKLMYFSVKFIPPRQWFVAAADCGYIYVYSYITMKEIKVLKAGGSRRVVSLAIHPTEPYLASASTDGVIKVWNWERGWACCRQVHLFSDNSSTTSFDVLVKFNPNDANTFTSCDQNGGLKVWSIYPSADQPITTIKQNFHSLYDHVFTEAAGRNHVIIMPRSDLEIWDLQTGTRVRRLYLEYGCTAVACHPTLPLILVALKINSRTQAFQFWNATSYRLQKTYYLPDSGIVDSIIRHLGFSGSRRIVLGTDKQMAIVEIDMESLVRQHVMPSQASGLPESPAEAAEARPCRPSRSVSQASPPEAAETRPRRRSRRVSQASPTEAAEARPPRRRSRSVSQASPAEAAEARPRRRSRSVRPCVRYAGPEWI